MIIHIIPENDEKEHELDGGCHCGPNATFENDNCIYNHHPYDLRIGLELTRAVLNQPQDGTKTWCVTAIEDV